MLDMHEGVTGHINLGNLGEYTMLELAEKMLKLTGSSSSSYSSRRRKTIPSNPSQTLRWLSST